MCKSCDNTPNPSSTHFPRRDFFKTAGAAILGLAVPGLLHAASKKAPPLARNVISPDAALERLMKGNARYVSGNMHQHDFLPERAALALGQNPFAGFLSCADSRVAPEYAFDTGRGDSFVCRVAGNFANADSIASFEFGVAVLGLPLILVLGHDQCGAIDSTIKNVKDGVQFPGHIPSLTRALAPAVKKAMTESGDLLANATVENVRMTVKQLKNDKVILGKAIGEGKLRIVGGIYRLETGKVDFLDI